jgi:ribosomal protein L44E
MSSEERAYTGPRYRWDCDECGRSKTLSYRPGCFVRSYCKRCGAMTEHVGVSLVAPEQPSGRGGEVVADQRGNVAASPVVDGEHE